MGVIGPQGIVGKVIDTSENYCLVMSLLNRNNKVSAMLKKGLYTGIVFWDGKDARYVTMNNVPKTAKVKIGDSVVTSNLSGSYPPGIMIGTVAALQTDPSSSSLELKLKTSTDFYSIQYAYMVNNMIWIEQKELEAKTPKESK